MHLAVGLPTTWTGRQRESYRRYMMRNPDVRFVFNDVQYTIHLTDCSVFPQGYAALVPMMDSDKKYNEFRQFNGTVMMADIGNGTMNIMLLVDGKPNDQHCWTEVLGVNQCVLTARKQMMDKYGIDLPETVIEQFLRTGTVNITQELLDNLTAIVRGYVTGLFDALRIHGYAEAVKQINAKFYDLRSRRRKNADLSTDLAARISIYEDRKNYQRYNNAWSKLTGTKRSAFEERYEFELRKYREAGNIIKRWEANGERIDYKGWREALKYLNKERFLLDYELREQKEKIRRLEVVKREFIKENKRMRPEQYER